LEGNGAIIGIARVDGQGDGPRRQWIDLPIADVKPVVRKIKIADVNDTCEETIPRVIGVISELGPVLAHVQAIEKWSSIDGDGVVVSLCRSEDHREVHDDLRVAGFDLSHEERACLWIIKL